MIKRILIAGCLFLGTSYLAKAQQESDTIEEDMGVIEEEGTDEYDFSNMVASEKVKAFCSSRILDQ